LSKQLFTEGNNVKFSGITKHIIKNMNSTTTTDRTVIKFDNDILKKQLKDNDSAWPENILISYFHFLILSYVQYELAPYTKMYRKDKNFPNRIEFKNTIKYSSQVLSSIILLFCEIIYDKTLTEEQVRLFQKSLLKARTLKHIERHLFRLKLIPKLPTTLPYKLLAKKHLNDYNFVITVEDWGPVYWMLLHFMNTRFDIKRRELTSVEMSILDDWAIYLLKDYGFNKYIFCGHCYSHYTNSIPYLEHSLRKDNFKNLYQVMSNFHKVTTFRTTLNSFIYPDEEINQNKEKYIEYLAKRNHSFNS
jgi:hypothetical protein